MGLTGGFGTGKSTVLEMFRRKGARVMDADAIVHRLFARDARLCRAVIRKFGRGVAGLDAGIDRKALAARVFRSTADRRSLERIVHPRVREEILAGMAKTRRGVVIADIPLLFESGWSGRFDRVVVVRANSRNRVRRLAARGFSARDFQRRARAQWPLSKKVRLADHVVDNNGTRARTRKQIDEIWEKINQPRHVVRGRHGFTERT